MPWFEANDTIGSFMSVMPKDVGNLPQGVQTYGFWEYVCFLDDLFYDLWIHCADGYGMGLGCGLIASSMITKCFFTPSILYSVSRTVYLALLKYILTCFIRAANRWYEIQAYVARLRRNYGIDAKIQSARSKLLQAYMQVT